ncbi:Chromodomain helicase hrp1 [Entamoeba marina]
MENHHSNSSHLIKPLLPFTHSTPANSIKQPSVLPNLPTLPTLPTIPGLENVGSRISLRPPQNNNSNQKKQSLPSFFPKDTVVKPKPVKASSSPVKTHYSLRQNARRNGSASLSAPLEDDSMNDDYEIRRKTEKPLLNEIIDNYGTPKQFEKIISIKEEENDRKLFIKWKGRSYLHAEWISSNDFNVDGAAQKIKRFQQRKKDEEDELFPPEFTQVDRIIAVNQDKTRYLVKWGKMGYDDATWESIDDINDDVKLEEFHRFQSTEYVEPLNKRIWEKKMESPVFRHGNTLRSYQLDGHNWLIFNWCNGRGSILADEMGLGKTIQVVSFLEHLKSFQKLPGPFLIVMPLSTIGHWKRVLEDWTDMNVVVYAGGKDNRSLIRHYEWSFLGPDGKPLCRQIKFHALLTTYEMLMSDYEQLSQTHWQVIVVDEAQRLKNKDSKLLQAITKINTYHKILLTGTPIQNNINELWTLLNYIEPTRFPSLEKFNEDFGDLQDNPGQITHLQEMIKPFFLRRMKDDVEKSIPPKEETIIEVELTLIQKQYYRALFEKNREFLNKGCTSSNVPNLQNLMMQLRKVCNHPYLISGVEDKETSQFPFKSDEYYNNLIRSSGKLVLLDKLLPKLYEDHHKVLIFSQLKKVLDVIQKYLEYRSYTYERLDGSVRANDRQNSIDRFMNPEMNRFVFLLCTRAGGFGINLSEADTVIIYDSDWNPQNDLQAQARCHRIGQKKEVKVYRLVSKNTYERYMFERASMKLGLDQAILSNVGSAEPKDNDKLSKEEIEHLLKFGAYGAFKDDDESSKKFCEEDIDKILEQRSSKVVWKGETVTGGSFSTATFQSEAGENIDVNDPNFWDYVMPKNKTASELFKEITDVFSKKRSNQRKLKEWLANDRSIFLKNVFDYIEVITSAYRAVKGQIHPDRDVVVKILDAIISHGEYFEDEDVEAASNNLEVLRFSRGGRGRRRSASVNLEVAEVDDIPPPRRKRSTAMNTLSNETKLFWYNAIISYGRVDWDILRDRAQISDETSEEELRVLTEEFLRNCIVACIGADIDHKYFTKLLNLFGKGRRRKRDDPENGELQEEFSWIAGEVKKWSVRLKYLNRLSTLFKNPEEALEILDNVVGGECGFKRPTPWWDGVCDKDLVIGVWKYGFSASEYLQSDPALCFQNYIREQDENDQHCDDDDDDDEAGMKIVIEIPKEFPDNKDLDHQAKAVISWLDKRIREKRALEADDS